MTAEIANGAVNGTLPSVKSSINGDVVPNGKKSFRESERRRRRRKQKKNKNPTAISSPDGNDPTRGDDSEGGDAAEDGKKNDNPLEVEEKVEIEYVPEKAELEDVILEEFKKVLEKFSFKDATSGAEGDDKQDENAQNEASKKKPDADSDDEDLDTQQKEKGGLSNKKKKLQRRMKIAELKQICSRPDVVEAWHKPKLIDPMACAKPTHTGVAVVGSGCIAETMGTG